MNRQSKKVSSAPAPALVLLLLCTAGFTTATLLQPKAEGWTGNQEGDPLMQVLLGDGRRLLATQFFVTADIYFHNGYYPSIFDQQFAPTNTAHMTRGATSPPGEGDASHADEQREEEEHEQAMAFLDRPHDWIERFGRAFTINQHTHLTGGREREILPWLRLSADLDPKRTDTYTVAAYWLRRRLGKAKEAEQFLREGLRANPESYEILFELGSLYYENYHDLERARNVWEAAVQRWKQSEAKGAKPDVRILGQITARLAALEEEEGHHAKAIHWLMLTLEKKASPNPRALRARIEELQAKLREPKSANP